jgi:hypothetical protein
MNTDFNRRQSLQQLEQSDWGEPTYRSSLVRTCHALRRKPLAEFTVEDLRIMIGQQISLPYLIPLALEHLEVEPLAEGSYYPGDLLSVVLKVDVAFWNENLGHKQKLLQVVEGLKVAILEVDEIDREAAERLLDESRHVQG